MKGWYPTTCAAVISSHYKGNRSECNSYRGISPLSNCWKVFTPVLLNRLQSLAERVYPEAQCRFRAGRSTIDMIVSLRQRQEKCRKQRQPLYIAFVDLAKAFELVSKNGLFTMLQRTGCPPTLLKIIPSIHKRNMIDTVQPDGSSSDPSPIRNGVKQ